MECESNKQAEDEGIQNTEALLESYL